jgi:transketolase
VSISISDDRLKENCQAIKRRFLAMYRRVGAGHVGCSLSCAEMLTFVRLAWQNEKDSLILSKGHAAAALYATLAEAGDISAEQIDTFYQDGTYLSAHPPPNKLTGIPFATGSLGHGLSLAAGLALGARLQGSSDRVFCVTSDGELNEGSTWEAALFAAHHRLSNLIWLIDRNGIQGFGRTEEVMALEPLAAKLRAFGWSAYQADGHDFNSLAQARTAVETCNAPAAVICKTIKGHGLEKTENTVDCHYLPMTPEQYNGLLHQLDPQPERGQDA